MKKLTFREILAVASMLFGMFFGAGNLIFPASMGQMAGRSVFLASLGLLVTGVGLPLLGVVPEDEQVMLAANLGQPLILATRGDGAARAYWNIAKRLEGLRVPIMHLR